VNPKMAKIYIGVDTHKTTHTAVAINCFNEKLGEITFENRPSAFAEFLNTVNSYAEEGVNPVFGLEDATTYGRTLARFLLDKKLTVKQICPILTSAERKKRPIPNKTDSADARYIAKILYDEYETLPDAYTGDIFWALKTMVNRRSAMVKVNTAQKNQLHDLLMHHYPSYKKFFNVFDCQTALEFWERYPSPSTLAGVTEQELAELLHQFSSGFLSRDRAARILDLVSKDGDTTTTYQEIRDEMVVACVKEIKRNNQEIKKLEIGIEKLVNATGYKLHTMIGVSIVTAAEFIAEIGDIGHFPTAAKLAMYCGIAPVCNSSGAKDQQKKNSRGNRKLYQLFRDLAARNINQGRNGDRPVNGIMRDFYEKKLSQGKNNYQAILCVMRRLVNIVHGLLKNRTTYVHPSIPKQAS